MEEIKKQRKIAFILFLISIFMISAGGISSLIIGLKEDKKMTNMRMEEVNLEYEDYSTMVSLFEEERDNMYGKIFNNLTFDSIFANNKDIHNKISNYEAMVDEIYKYTGKLDELCNDMYYPDSSVNNICNNYKIIYEQVNNYFVLDIKEYNKNVDKYNEYIKGIDSNLIIKKYETKKKLEDFDKDGEIVGKDDE